MLSSWLKHSVNVFLFRTSSQWNKYFHSNDYIFGFIKYETVCRKSSNIKIRSAINKQKWIVLSKRLPYSPACSWLKHNRMAQKPRKTSCLHHCSFHSWSKQLKGYTTFYSTGCWTKYKFAILRSQQQTSFLKINVSLKTLLLSPFILGCNSNVGAHNAVHTYYLNTDSLLHWINTKSAGPLWLSNDQFSPKQPAC